MKCHSSVAISRDLTESPNTLPAPRSRLPDGEELVDIVPYDPRGKVTPMMSVGRVKLNLRRLMKDEIDFA